MALLSGHSDYPGSRVPIRVERLSGVVAALTTTNLDGTWETQVEPGDYVVVERYGKPYRVTVTGGGTSTTTASGEFPPGSPGNSPRARARREGTS